MKQTFKLALQDFATFSPQNLNTLFSHYNVYNLGDLVAKIYGGTGYANLPEGIDPNMRGFNEIEIMERLGVDTLVGADLSEADLTESDLEGVNLQEANLNEAILINSDLRMANLIKANLRAADLSDANLSGANLDMANLSRAILSNATIDNAYLSQSDLREADLSHADLTYADLRSADLRGANLTSANLSRAKLMGADLTDANLRYASLASANLTDATITNADLTHVNLRNTNLTNVTGRDDPRSAFWIDSESEDEENSESEDEENSESEDEETAEQKQLRKDLIEEREKLKLAGPIAAIAPDPDIPLDSNRSDCNNINDPITLEHVNDIPDEEIIRVKVAGRIACLVKAGFMQTIANADKYEYLKQGVKQPVSRLPIGDLVYYVEGDIEKIAEDNEKLELEPVGDFEVNKKHGTIKKLETVYRMKS